MGVKVTQFAYDDEWNKRKIAVGATWKQVMEAGITALEKGKGIKPKPESKPEAEIPEEDEEVYLQLTKPTSVIKREVDVFRNKQWRPSPFDEIDMGSIFRVRDDDVVMILDGFKKFEKRGPLIEKEGINYALVVPISAKINEVVNV